MSTCLLLKIEHCPLSLSITIPQEFNELPLVKKKELVDKYLLKDFSDSLNRGQGALSQALNLSNW